MRRLLFLTLVLIVPFCFAKEAIPSNSCSSDFVGTKNPSGDWNPPRSCDTFKSGSIPYKKLVDGTVLPNSALLFQLKTNPLSSRDVKVETNDPVPILEKALIPSPSQKRRVLVLANSLKETAIMIARQRGASKQIINRLTDLDFDMKGPAGLGGCDSLQTDAKWLPNSNVVVICPSVQNYPLEALVPILAHEIGHSVDPCHFDELLIDPLLAKKFANGEAGRFKDCGLKGEVNLNIANQLKDAAALKRPMIMADGDFASVLYTCKYAQPVPIDNPTINPWKGISNCLSDHARTKSNRGKEITELVDSDAWALGEAFTGKLLSPPLKLSSTAVCDSISKETFADHVGADLTNEYLLTHPIAGKVGSNLLWYYKARNCFRPSNSGGSYPEPSIRAAAFLQYATIRAAVACSGAAIEPICPSAGSASTRAKDSQTVN